MNEENAKEIKIARIIAAKTPIENIILPFLVFVKVAIMGTLVTASSMPVTIFTMKPKEICFMITFCRKKVLFN